MNIESFYEISTKLQARRINSMVTRSSGKALRKGMSPMRSRPRSERRTTSLQLERSDKGRPGTVGLILLNTFQ